MYHQPHERKTRAEKHSTLKQAFVGGLCWTLPIRPSQSGCSATSEMRSQRFCPAPLVVTLHSHIWLCKQLQAIHSCAIYLVKRLMLNTLEKSWSFCGSRFLLIPLLICYYYCHHHRNKLFGHCFVFGVKRFSRYMSYDVHFLLQVAEKVGFWRDEIQFVFSWLRGISFYGFVKLRITWK